MTHIQSSDSKRTTLKENAGYDSTVDDLKLFKSLIEELVVKLLDEDLITCS
jgi:hypothetical protein